MRVWRPCVIERGLAKYDASAQFAFLHAVCDCQAGYALMGNASLLTELVLCGKGRNCISDARAHPITPPYMCDFTAYTSRELQLWKIVSRECGETTTRAGIYTPERFLALIVPPTYRHGIDNFSKPYSPSGSYSKFILRSYIVRSVGAGKGEDFITAASSERLKAA